MMCSRVIFHAALLLLSSGLRAQASEYKRNVVREVFDHLVDAYGHAKTAPVLELIGYADENGIPASYVSEPIPTIRLEEKAYDVCTRMQEDSLNALALILSHELAHYYNDHTWWSHWVGDNRNEPVATRIPLPSKEDQLKYETQADHYAYFYSCIAGYSPYGVFEQLIDAIYESYGLPNIIPGYLTKEDRKHTNRQASEQIKKWYPVYDAGLVLLYSGQFSAAEACYDYLARFFPSREMYNNLGVAKFFSGMALKPYEKINFLYPVDIDPVSRIYQNGPRGGEGRMKYITLLEEAKKHFEKAKSLDPEYYPSYLNLACVNDALGNYQGALGNIFEATQLPEKDTAKLNQVEGIIQYHLGNTKMAGHLLQTEVKDYTLSAYNFGLLRQAIQQKDIITIENYKNQFVDSLLVSQTNQPICDQILTIVIPHNAEPTEISSDLSITSTITDSGLSLKIKYAGKEIDATTHTMPADSSSENELNPLFVSPTQGCLQLGGKYRKMIKYSVK